MRTKKISTRTCVGCRAMRPQKELVRFGGKTGRGAYFCLNMACFEEAMKKKSLNRALGREVTLDEINDFKKDFIEKIKNSAHSE